MSDRAEILANMYQAMQQRLGPSRWWPGQSPFEIALGAILTQNTNWANVAQAIERLRQAGVLEPRALYDLPEAELAELIRPAGYFRVKAARIRHFLEFLKDYCDLEIEALAGHDTGHLRDRLLEIKGIGPETADCILLYALGKPTFVVDAYTRRIYHRHLLVPEDISYEELREFFLEVLPEDAALYNEYHALLVRTAKNWCRKSQPLCGQCPLGPFLSGEAALD